MGSLDLHVGANPLESLGTSATVLQLYLDRIQEHHFVRIDDVDDASHRQDLW